MSNKHQAAYKNKESTYIKESHNKRYHNSIIYHVLLLLSFSSHQLKTLLYVFFCNSNGWWIYFLNSLGPCLPSLTCSHAWALRGFLPTSHVLSSPFIILLAHEAKVLLTCYLSFLNLSAKIGSLCPNLSSRCSLSWNIDTWGIVSIELSSWAFHRIVLVWCFQTSFFNCLLIWTDYTPQIQLLLACVNLHFVGAPAPGCNLIFADCLVAVVTYKVKTKTILVHELSETEGFCLLRT